jgi:hypothetical protein
MPVLSGVRTGEPEGAGMLMAAAIHAEDGDCRPAASFL